MPGTGLSAEDVKTDKTGEELTFQEGFLEVSTAHLREKWGARALGNRAGGSNDQPNDKCLINSVISA